jgi:nucleoside-diphosphate-sugar epimerase
LPTDAAVFALYFGPVRDGRGRQVIDLPIRGIKGENVKVFITGATGYIGGSLAARLVAAGHQVLGLVRQQDKAAQLKARGIEPVLGTLADLSVVASAARCADAVINAASSDDSFVADAIIEALAGSGKALLHTSGSSVVADRGAGEYSDLVFNEDSPFEPLPERLLRIAVERNVLLAARRNVAASSSARP